MKQLPYIRKAPLAGALAAVGLVFLLAGATEVSAQFMGRGMQLEPEQQEAVWTLAARGVANDIGLSAENTSKLIETYVAARESYNAATAEMVGNATPGGGMGGGMFGSQNLELEAAEQEKFGEALEDFLSEEQVTGAMETLGTFSSEWDMLLNVIAGFELEDETLFEALAPISKYIVDLEETTANALANRDFQTMMSSRQTLKSTLDATMAGILSPSQFITWTSETAMRPRGAGGGGFPGGGF